MAALHPTRLRDLSCVFASLTCLASTGLMAQVTYTKHGVQRVAPRRLVNAPVAPEAIYIGRKDGISVIDLNGFGQGTGSIRLFRDPKHNFGYKRNPNIGQPGVFPAYYASTRNMDAGSAGALTLTVDDQGSTRLFGGLEDANDMALGQALDLVYNNENINPNVTPANHINPFLQRRMRGNTIGLAPVPNPPPLVIPAPNPVRGIAAIEATTSNSAIVGPCLVASARNKLLQGDPFSRTQSGLGVFYTPLTGAFLGPQPAPAKPWPPTPYCPYSTRQQIGHFLYVLDRTQKRVHIVNSNRMTSLGRIDIRLAANASLTDMAMAPNLKYLAIADSRGQIHFVDTDPLSRSFHRLLGALRLSRSITQLAWQPEGEALLATHAASNALTIIDGSSFRARTLTGMPLRTSRGLAISSRQFRHGIGTWTWFAFVLNADGSVAAYESGPRPIGPDALRATGLRFPNARTIKIGATLEPTCYVLHEDALGDVTCSHFETVRTSTGARQWRVRRRIRGTLASTRVRDRMSGKQVVDLAFDEIENRGALVEYASALYPDLPKAEHSSKGLARWERGRIVPSSTRRFAFVAFSDGGGKVDVFDLSSGKLLRTLPAPGVQTLAHYWRQ